MGLNRRHFLSGAAALLAAPRVAFAGEGASGVSSSSSSAARPTGSTP